MNRCIRDPYVQWCERRTSSVKNPVRPSRLAVVPLLHSMYSGLKSAIVEVENFCFMSLCFKSRVIYFWRICRVTISAGGGNRTHSVGLLCPISPILVRGRGTLGKGFGLREGSSGLWQVCCLRWLHCRVTQNSCTEFCRGRCFFLDNRSLLLLSVALNPKSNDACLRVLTL